MPRLTNQRYVEIHQLLRRYWLEDPAPYACLTPNEQWDLHEFFQPYKILSDADLVKHRRAVSSRSSSLPHRAGRALKRFEGATEAISQWRAQVEVQSAVTKQKRVRLDGPIKVWPLVQPEIDARKIARALVALAKLKQK